MTGDGIRHSRGSGQALYLFITCLLILTAVTGELSFRGLGLDLAWQKSLFFQVWLAATLILTFLLYRRREEVSAGFGADNRWIPMVLTAVVLIFMLSDVRLDGWYFFLKPGSGFRLLLLAPLMAILMEAVERKNLGRILYPLLLAAAQLYLLFCLYQTTGGEPIYRDDHASFLYRLWILPRIFPSLIFFNPFWNGGYIGTELISSGTLSLGFPAMPFLALFGAYQSYLPLLSAVFLIGIPWITYLAVRSLGLPPLTAWAAAFLSLGTNRFFFVNLLTYGTAPSLLVSFLLMPVWVILYGAVTSKNPGWVRWLCLVAALNLMIFWPPSLLMLLPLGLSFLTTIGSLNRRTVFFLATAALVLALLNGWWIYHYLGHPKIIAFARADAGHQSTLQIGTVMRSLSGAMKQTNPLLLAAGLLGMIWPARRREAGWLIPPLLALMLMIGLGPQLKPHLQLHRMIIPLCFLMIVPAASAMARTIEGRGFSTGIARGTVAALVLMTVLNVGSLLKNRGTERFWPMSRETRELTAWIKDNVPEDGRVFFAGSTVHGYGGGHVSFLQAATGRSMIAGDYYHFDMKLTDYNPVPRYFRGDKKKLVDYFRLMGVTHIVTYHQNWKELLKRRKRYTLAGSFGRLAIYETGMNPGYLLEGEGRVDPYLNRLEVSLDSPVKEAVLKFNWQEGLKADQPVRLSPVEVAPGVVFISVSPGGETAFTIRYDP